jgi:hypothetical protein
MMAEGEEGRGFTIKDRRRFSPETGEARPEVEEEGGGSGEGRADAATTAAKGSEQAGRASPEESARHPEPEITLSTFIMSLSTQVLMHLGEIPSPVDQRVEQDLGAAKQVIDILGMLKEKTKGNLEANEEKLLDGVLYDLRMRYVELLKPQSRQ